MNLDSVRTDVRYAMGQLAKAKLLAPNRAAWDPIWRALDALERVEEALAGQAEVDAAVDWTAEDILRNEG